MIQINTSCHPAVHRICIEIARKCTAIIEPLLRPEEIDQCLRELYIAAREVIDRPPARPEV